jgi:hypothetical protein
MLTRADLIVGLALATGSTIGKMRIDDQSEVYAVKDTVWAAAGMDEREGCLCIGCLESRIGRRLKPRDFDKRHPFADVPGTDRLLSRRDALPSARGRACSCPRCFVGPAQPDMPR